jgi:hypothetical protein
MMKLQNISTCDSWKSQKPNLPTYQSVLRHKSEDHIRSFHRTKSLSYIFITAITYIYATFE